VTPVLLREHERRRFSPSPSRGGPGWGWVAAMQPLPNRLEDSVDVIEYLIVPEPQHKKSRLLQKRGAYPIDLNVFRVLTAIQLDNNPPFQANEVQDVVPERVLTPELQSSSWRRQRRRHSRRSASVGAVRSRRCSRGPRMERLVWAFIL
jgi:hypothetical protein